MKNFSKGIFVSLIASLVLVGCVKDAKQSIKDGDFRIDFLFEKNGCKMYRFSDGGRYIYWSDCRGKVTQDYSVQSGKTRVTRHVESITSK